MKKYFSLFLSLFLIAGVATASFAGGHDKKKDSMKDKFFEKVKMIYKHQDALEVSDDQMKEIKKIKIDLKKELIKTKAEIELVKIDIKSMMYEEDINVNAVNKLIEKKYALKEAKAKKLVASLVALKKTLTKEQIATMKKMYKEKSKCSKCDKKSKCSKCTKDKKCKKCSKGSDKGSKKGSM